MIKLRETKLITAPLVRIPFDLYANIMALVKGTDASECQWYHRILKTQEGIRTVYTLSGMYIPKQVVTGASVDSPASSWLALWQELKEKHTDENGKPDINALNEIFSTMHCWAHSHVNMETVPSSTDETQYLEWITGSLNQGVLSPIIMMIVNRRESFFIRLVDPVSGLEIENPQVEISYPDVDTSWVEAEIKNKISKRTVNYFPVRLLNGTSQASPPTNWLVTSGRRFFGNLDSDLKTISTVTNCEESAIKVLNRVMDRFKNKPDHLALFTLLLDADIQAIEQYTTGKALDPNIEEVIYAKLVNWVDGVDIFYGCVGATNELLELHKNKNPKLTNAEKAHRLEILYADIVRLLLNGNSTDMIVSNDHVTSQQEFAI